MNVGGVGGFSHSSPSYVNTQSRAVELRALFNWMENYKKQVEMYKKQKVNAEVAVVFQLNLF